MKASTLVPDLLTPALVTSDITCHYKAFQSQRHHLEVTKTQPTMHTHKQPCHPAYHSLLVESQLMLLYQGKLWKVTGKSFHVPCVSDKSGNEAQTLMANLPLRMLKCLTCWRDCSFKRHPIPCHTAVNCGLAGALQVLLLDIRKQISSLLCSKWRKWILWDTIGDSA